MNYNLGGCVQAVNLLYKQIFDDINTGIITINSNMKVTSFNPAAERISGFQTNEVIGRSLEQKLPDIELKQRGKIRPITDLTRRDQLSVEDVEFELDPRGAAPRITLL